MDKKYKTAALVIDMQPEFLQEYLLENARAKFWNGNKNTPKLEMLPGNVKYMIQNQRETLVECISRGIPIGIVEYEGGGETILDLKEVWKRSSSNIYALKYNDSAFRGTDLEEQLNQKGVENLILMGINADYCVYSTAIDGVKKGFKIFTSPGLIDNANGSLNKSDDWYQQNGVWVEKPERVLESLAS